MGSRLVPLRGAAIVTAALAAVCIALGSASAALADGVPFNTGDVLVSLGNGTIGHFSPSGTLLDTLDTTSGSTDETGMCFDTAGNLYTTNFEAGTVSKFDKNGNLVNAAFGGTTVFSGNDPESCAVNQSNQVYVGQADGTRQVLQFDSSGTLLNHFSPMTEDRGTDWIDLAADQHTLHYTSEGSSVLAFDVGTNTQLSAFATGLPAPCFAHRILPDGEELVACETEAVRLSASGAIVQTYPVDPLDGLFALSIDPDGTSFWTADFDGTVYHVDIASGTVIGSFNANPVTETGGLAVVGELTAAIDPPITATGVGTVKATEGTPFSGAVAHFTDPDTTAAASDYSASVSWGDGSTSTGTISGSAGTFTVNGTHTYAEEGTHTITVTITDVDNTANSATATSTANVADAALTATGVSFSAKKGVTFSQTVANFTDANPAAPTSDFSASIAWGDSSSSSGSVAKNGTAFTVSGSHEYTSSGTFHVTVTIKDKGGSMATATSTITVTATATAPAARARLRAVPTKCVVSSTATLQVVGTGIASVKWTEDGHVIHGKTRHRGTRYSASIKTPPGHHHITVRVTFVKASHAKARTLHATVRGCHAVTFTG